MILEIQDTNGQGINKMSLEMEEVEVVAAEVARVQEGEAAGGDW